MKCPSCNEIDLLMSERQGIEIDYCPKCRGVWLDRGELDKFIQQSERQTPVKDLDIERADSRFERRPSESTLSHESHVRSQHDRYRRDDVEVEHGSSQRGKKKESFWGSFFDFD